MERSLRVYAAAFGKLTEAQWRHMLKHSARRLEDGRYTTGYDPGIAENLKTMEVQDIDLWRVWDAIHCSTLVLRGVYSDVLDPADALAMTERGPKAALIEFPGIGHAPALMDDAQIAVVRDLVIGRLSGVTTLISSTGLPLIRTLLLRLLELPQCWAWWEPPLSRRTRGAPLPTPADNPIPAAPA